jgi:hypothetical protein
MRNTFHLNTMIKQRRRMQVIQPRDRYVGEKKDIEDRLDDEFSRKNHLEVDQGPAPDGS